ncbi:MAG: pyruvate dehydrogenase complex dihydrolipoamide acetyltransferase [Alkalispirochaeta sp.]
MAEKVPMTALSPTMEEGTIAGWSAKEGDTISAGDVLCEVETDKASMDYEATQEGTLLKIVVPEGGQAKVGQTIAILGEKGEDTSDIENEIAQEGDSSGAETDAPKPADEHSEEKSTSGSDSEASDKQQTSSTDKAETADTGEPKAGTTDKRSGSSAGSDGSRIKASPLAVKLAAERNINLNLVSGSGPDGRIVKRDIEEFRGVPGGAGATSTSAGSASAPAAEDQVIPVAGKRAVIAKRLSESKFSAPHYYVKMSVDMDSMVNARKMLNATLPEKVSLNAFFIKFVAEALKRHPNVNASWQGENIVQYGSIDIGIAVDAGNGLITPVVKNCGNRGIVDIDADLQELITKARDGKLKPEEYTGATFTISNLGSFGVDEFTAIINPPGSAILALGATRPTPVVTSDGSLGVGNIMKMTLSCDHRVIDGAAGGRFLHDLQQMMEQPVRIIF